MPRPVAAQQYAPVIREFYNASGSTISKGYAVRFGTSVVTVAAPVDEADATIDVLTIQVANDAEELVIGIAAEDIPDGTRGKVVVGGRFDEANLASGQSIAVGDRLVTNASGQLIEGDGSEKCVIAFALEAKTTAGALKVELHPERV